MGLGVIFGVSDQPYRIWLNSTPVPFCRENALRNSFQQGRCILILSEQFIHVGNWLFRWRSYLPLLIFSLLLLTLPEFRYFRHSEVLEHFWEGFCLIVIFFGLGIRAFTIGHTPKGTSGRNTKKQIAKSLNTTGIYSMVRNPLYLGNFFMWLGIVLFVHLWWLTIIYILAFCLYYEKIIYAEESFLIEKFGNKYLEWAKATPAFVPRFSHYQKPDLPFSIKNVLRREYNGFFAAILASFILEIFGGLFSTGKLDFDLGWTVIMGTAFIIWITLRTLKRHTKVLDVEGR